MTKKIENRVNIYFNKTQQDVCEYLNNVPDKSAFVVDLVRKHMYNREILSSGISDNLEMIKDSLLRLEETINNGVSIAVESEKKDTDNSVESSVSEKNVDPGDFKKIDKKPSEMFDL